MKLEINEELRKKILGITGEYKYGGIERYSGLTSSGLEELIQAKLIDPEESHNDAPTVQEIAEFLGKHPGFTAHGYAVSPNRDDYRISIEGVESSGPVDSRDAMDFANMFRHADEFELSPKYCRAWFD